MTSVLSNFLCDACEAVAPAQLVEAANSEISLHVASLKVYLERCPQTRVVIVPPLPRLFPVWFNSYLPCFTSYLIGEVSKENGLIQVLAPFVALPSSFDGDGVHLNGDAGVCFIQYLINGIDQLVPASSLPSAPQQATPIAPAPVVAPSRFDPSVAPPSLLHEAVASLTSLTGTMRAEATARRSQDNLIFARLKEDQDYALNKNREDRFTVTGLQVSKPPPPDATERKEFFREILSDLILKACPDLDPQPKILDVFVNMRYGRGPPFIEARLDSTSASSAFRIAASKLAKDEAPDFSGLFVANSVTLTTRVRIEILRAIAKILTSETEEAYVQNFSSRPMLHYQAREGVLRPAQGTNRSYSFVEAVGRWGDKLTTTSLLPAYRRARPAFIGCLEQYFVVLKESEPREDPSGFDQLFASGSNSHSLSHRGRGSRPYRRSHRGSRHAQTGHIRGGLSGGPSSSGRKRCASNEVQNTPSKKKENNEVRETTGVQDTDMSDPDETIVNPPELNLD